MRLYTFKVPHANETRLRYSIVALTLPYECKASLSSYRRKECHHANMLPVQTASNVDAQDKGEVDEQQMRKIYRLGREENSPTGLLSIFRD